MGFDFIFEQTPSFALSVIKGHFHKCSCKISNFGSTSSVKVSDDRAQEPVLNNAHKKDVTLMKDCVQKQPFAKFETSIRKCGMWSSHCDENHIIYMS